MILYHVFPLDLRHIKRHKTRLVARWITFHDLFLNNESCGVVENPLVVHKVPKLHSYLLALVNVHLEFFGILLEALGSDDLAQIEKDICGDGTLDCIRRLVQVFVCMRNQIGCLNSLFIGVV